MKNNIKVQRAIHNLTQADLAEKIGVSQTNHKCYGEKQIRAFYSLGLKNSTTI